MGANIEYGLNIVVKTSQKSKQSINNNLLDMTSLYTHKIYTNINLPTYISHQQGSNQLRFLPYKTQNYIGCLSYQSQQYEQCLVYKINRINKKQNSKLWKNIKQYDQIKIQQGDFIRLGGLQFQVKSLKFNNKKISLKKATNLMDSPIKNQYLNVGKDLISPKSTSSMNNSLTQSFISLQDRPLQIIQIQNKCRYCLSSHSYKNNPLLSICSCIGSVQYIHYKCIKKGIQQKVNKKQSSHCIYYNFQTIICEICKKQIKNQIFHENKIFILFQPEEIYPPFITLKHKSQKKTLIIIIRLQQSGKLQFGRNKNSDIIIDDKTIDKSHGFFYFSDHQLTLNNYNSKYGCFLQLKRDLILNSGLNLQIVIQNQLIVIEKNNDKKSFFQKKCCQNQKQFKILIN